MSALKILPRSAPALTPLHTSSSCMLLSFAIVCLRVVLLSLVTNQLIPLATSILSIRRFRFSATRRRQTPDKGGSDFTTQTLCFRRRQLPGEEGRLFSAQMPIRFGFVFPPCRTN